MVLVLESEYRIKQSEYAKNRKANKAIQRELETFQV